MSQDNYIIVSTIVWKEKYNGTGCHPVSILSILFQTKRSSNCQNVPSHFHPSLHAVVVSPGSSYFVWFTRRRMPRRGRLVLFTYVQNSPSTLPHYTYIIFTQPCTHLPPCLLLHYLCSVIYTYVYSFNNRPKLRDPPRQLHFHPLPGLSSSSSLSPHTTILCRGTSNIFIQMFRGNDRGSLECSNPTT